ncbi:Exosome complex component RRP46 [Ceratocystis lukuohia]|uniref:Exosome complex component RRP46 n=2 Tax=Ceratocystis TaxID=5157 RepID=A0A0F8BY31_CERFI|nr:Exosome complex component RRP46 [Ceratocystis platani]
MSSGPEVHLSPLPRADGSAAFSHNGYKVLSSVNGPIEAPKKDEAAFEANIDLIVRPAAGVGGTRERHLESLLHAALSSIIPLKNFPRCLIQIVLQITETPENDYVNAKIVQAQANLAAIPALLHSAILGLMAAAIPLNCLASATVLATAPTAEADGGKQAITVDPSAVEISRARAVHVFSFTSKDELLMAESEGEFSAIELADAMAVAKDVCCRAVKEEQGLDTAMEGTDGNEPTNMRQFMQSVVEAKLRVDMQWKIGA